MSEDNRVQTGSCETTQVRRCSPTIDGFASLVLFIGFMAVSREFGRSISVIIHQITGDPDAGKPLGMVCFLMGTLSITIRMQSVIPWTTRKLVPRDPPQSRRLLGYMNYIRMGVVIFILGAGTLDHGGIWTNIVPKIFALVVLLIWGLILARYLTTQEATMEWKTWEQIADADRKSLQIPKDE